jgi:hypothetical protein
VQRNANLACHCAVMRMVVETEFSISMYLASVILVRQFCYPHELKEPGREDHEATGCFVHALGTVCMCVAIGDQQANTPYTRGTRISIAHITRHTWSSLHHAPTVAQSLEAKHLQSAQTNEHSS